MPARRSLTRPLARILQTLTGTPRLLRQLLKELAALRQETARQADALTRLVNRLAPVPAAPLDHRPAGATEAPPPQPGDLSYLDPDEQAHALAYVEQTERAGLGSPTEDEILTYLADEHTIALHERLREREQELARRSTRR